MQRVPALLYPADLLRVNVVYQQPGRRVFPRATGSPHGALREYRYGRSGMGASCLRPLAGTARLRDVAEGLGPPRLLARANRHPPHP
eukprot:3296270-Pyramimonas_sp.AAC.1